MVLRGFAKVISLLFHPLLMLTYMTVLLLVIQPFWFGVHRISDKIILLLAVFFSSFVIPGVAVLMMRFLGLVESMELRDKKERIGPYIVTGIFYLWLYINFRNDSGTPPVFSSFVLGSVIGLFLAFFINIFSKISAHAVGMGGLIGMFIILLGMDSLDPVLIHLGGGVVKTSVATLLLVTVLIAGMVGTSRLLLKAHEAIDLYGGYMVGLVAQLLAFRLLML
jgi:membrane-associated phospholipid phosphatase